MGSRTDSELKGDYHSLFYAVCEGGRGERVLQWWLQVGGSAVAFHV